MPSFPERIQSQNMAGSLTDKIAARTIVHVQKVTKVKSFKCLATDMRKKKDMNNKKKRTNGQIRTDSEVVTQMMNEKLQGILWKHPDPLFPHRSLGTLDIEEQIDFFG